MSLQRRLLLFLAVCAPLVWGLALLVSVNRARHEVNELFDSELIRLARQVQATMVPSATSSTSAGGRADLGEGDLHDLAIAVWDGKGRLLVTDREGAQLHWLPQASGFAPDTIDGQPWRIYYLRTDDGSRLVAAGQKLHERDELVLSLTASQLLPWLLVLPVLLGAMAWAVRRALAPMVQLSGDLRRRRAEDLDPLPEGGLPTELSPLVGAMNGLFARIRDQLARERRFTADAAHELRTPLAVLRAQWDVVRRAGDTDRARAEAQFEAGLQRLDRLVTQLLALSRAEAAQPPAEAPLVDWPPIVEEVVNDCLALAERRQVELACDWPADGTAALPVHGEPQLLAVLLRNLVDNAVRYGPEGGTVVLRMGRDAIEVENDGEPLRMDVAAVMGERFKRPPGQRETGSGLGVSIVQRIASLHRLRLDYDTCADGRGVRALLRPA
ncbi:MAG TPA: ATP-binding protein [Ramlibacter sp.]|jgi:two-component system sensor histidine kinase QseC|uniref:ATP-binding protein n=1 Tax=Ramlibacter sp. TaxID=1917967 RepID=UPI002D2435E1|nr:ATP-binding protein [Ramlibacter sp.]HZY19537.1 ATP-binding protein [Ramlibacter sp.]